MANIDFQDFTIQVTDAIENGINSALEEAAGELESAVKRESRVATGQTKNSFQHKVVQSEHAAYIGSNDINAIYEEFGTGEYALKGNGRKGGWSYKDEKGEWHHTIGKKPSRAFQKAFDKTKGKIINYFQNTFKGM